MRKSIVFFLIILLSISSIYSQKIVRYGLQGGVNISNIHNTGDFKSTNRGGYYIGFLSDIRVIKGLHIQPGLSFSLKGFTLSNPADFYNAQTGVRYSADAYYLSIPIGITYKFRLAKSLRLCLTAEPNFNFGVGGQTTTTFKGENTPSSSGSFSPKLNTFQSSKENLGLSRFDMGIFIGGGIEYGVIGIKAGYEFGLNNQKFLNGRLENSKWGNTRILITLLF